jgi:hypothetical protein
VGKFYMGRCEPNLTQKSWGGIEATAFTFLLVLLIACAPSGQRVVSKMAGRPLLPDYFAATRMLAERRGQQQVAPSGIDRRRSRSCDELLDSVSKSPRSCQRYVDGDGIPNHFAAGTRFTVCFLTSIYLYLNKTTFIGAQ